MKNIKPVNGVMLDNGIILSYDDPNEFIEAWPGIFMMISVMKGACHFRFSIRQESTLARSMM